MNTCDLLMTIDSTDCAMPVACTDDDTCQCDICRQINAGIRDTRRVTDNAVKAVLLLTCHDVMPDGRPRFVADFYWCGVYDVLQGN